MSVGWTAVVVVCLLCLGSGGAPQGACDRSRTLLTSSWGIISHGPPTSNYTQDSHCEWLIKANSSDKYITLRFQSMGTECSYDYVFVYDGDSFNSPLLGSFSGKTEPQEVVATSGFMLVLLYSDTNYVLEGFRAEFSITECRSNCSGRGECAGGRCLCKGGWGGRDCARALCPCAHPNGRCLQYRRCLCAPAHYGSSCSLSDRDTTGNKWHWLYSGGMEPRTAHTAVYIKNTDSLYVFGGYDLNFVLGDLIIFRFNTSLWEDDQGNILEEDDSMEGGLDGEALRAVMDKVKEEEKMGLMRPSNFFQYVLFSLTDNRTLGVRYQQEVHHKQQQPIHHRGRKVLRQSPEEEPDDMPSARYWHAASHYEGGFVIYGGKLEDGSLSDELWLYEVNKKRWSLRASSSRAPSPMARHSLTLAHDNWLYLVGGSLQDGQFSSKIFRIKLLTVGGEEKWEEVVTRGGRSMDLRLVGHTTVYQDGSLVLYGGIQASIARLSKLSDRLYIFHLDTKHWAEVHYPRTHLRDTYIPRERAFHTSTVIGNYMVVFGGYTHRHNKEEICYDNQLYLYHLGCHTWVSPDILGPLDSGSRYPKRQGVFGHAADLRNGNTLILVGGYHGNVNADLLAYVLPPTLASKNPEKYDPEQMCYRHRGLIECTADPECGWCRSDETCYGRTLGGNCTTNLQATRCPGLCPALSDCTSCLSHPPASRPPPIVTKLTLAHCSWCVHNARCHRINDKEFGVCGVREDTSGGEVGGWWGRKGTEVREAHLCRTLDKRPGLTFLKYKHPPDFTHPDEVYLMNATSAELIVTGLTRTELTLIKGDVTGRLTGFIHASPPWAEQLTLCTSYSKATLHLAQPNSSLEVVGSLSANSTACRVAERGGRPAMEEPGKYLVDFHAWRSNASPDPHTKMELTHNKPQETPKVFTFEYLEPYEGKEDCGTYTNCFGCLSDAQCGWCPATGTCMSREVQQIKDCKRGDDWSFLLLVPFECISCTNYVTCETCVESHQCEWWPEDARCFRKGRYSSAVTEISKCPAPCYKRDNCSHCLDGNGRCVWCRATEECFSFAVYTSQYQFGMCREWVDQSSNQQVGIRSSGCQPCSRNTNCSSCLRTLGCGWCYHIDNPILGACAPGDFSKPYVESCSAEVKRVAEGGNYSGLLTGSSEYETGWSYGGCPDVDECSLGLHNCHPQATCTNTHGAFTCACKQGYIGDGKQTCTKTCYNKCVHGYCEGAPQYSCKCDLGWTGLDCSVNCGCHNHSTCNQGVNICDHCMHFTTGEFCQFCKAGSYGNATSEDGCHRCNCNEHGNAELGVCDSVTGVCFCQDNTEGATCDKCKKGFYGDPRRGGTCYYECVGRGKIGWGESRGLGSRRAELSPWLARRGPPPPSDCLWIIPLPPPNHLPPNDTQQTNVIELTIENDINVRCGQNSIYVYDGLPSSITGPPGPSGQSGQVLGVFCSQEYIYPITVYAKSGVMTVQYSQSREEGGFNATLGVASCQGGRCGPLSSRLPCPNECNQHLEHGLCDKNYYRCLCWDAWGGGDCSVALRPSQVVFTHLFDSSRLPDHLDHLRKMIPRFGHSLLFDRRGSLWLFGGYSLSHGPLNDIRLFDTKNNTWMQVTIDSTNEPSMPAGRYFHGAAISQGRREIYVHGGLTAGGVVLNDFWRFSLKNQRWSEIQAEGGVLGGLGGHSLSLRRGEEGESLLVVGGFSPGLGLQPATWEFTLATNKWNRLNTTGHPPQGVYGHSAVWHWGTESLYVFGGYLYSINSTHISDHLYCLHYPTLTWSLLPTFSQFNPPRLNLPGARFLHSAVSTDDYLLVYGGRGELANTGDLIIAYSYACNHWIKLITKEVETVGNVPREMYGQAMAVDTETGGGPWKSVVVYLMGGRGTSSQVSRIHLPHDLCALYTTKDRCRSVLGCSFCSVTGPNSNTSFCYSNQRRSEDPCQSYNGTLRTSNGVFCNAGWLAARACDQFTSCTHCLASWPSDLHQVCKWCSNCGKCIPGGNSSDCSREGKCSQRAREIHLVDHCPELYCAASDCDKCTSQSSCTWTRQVMKTPEEGVTLAAGPVYDWNCVGQGINDRSSYKLKPVSICPPHCSQHTDCNSCLLSQGGEGGWHECRWSTRLGRCLAPSHQPLYCAGGVCGLVVSHNVSNCPMDCSAFSQCATCLQHTHCGWCHTKSNITGQGVCMEGSAVGAKEEKCQQDSWNYWECPEEDECSNGHHQCDPVREACVDQPKGYSCACARGYAGEWCAPVCHGGCGHGLCTAPNNCTCHFGYVGQFCSLQCRCNGHSNCKGPDALDECLNCMNNTQGAQCQRCKPLYVGDPTNNVECVPCLESCNGHTWICVNESVANVTFTTNSSREEVVEFLMENPTTKARCVGCGNRTRGEKCEKCEEGTFRGSEDPRLPCRPCHCNGHGNICDPVHGDKCNCSNNTESDTNCGGSKGQQCWSVQCSKCRESYMGNPTKGHQCYKQMTVDLKYCFDTKLIHDCKLKPAPLNPGHTVFFVVQPRFMNVDIRVTVDVTQGSLDLYLSPRDDTFIVHLNNTTGSHQILIDPRYKLIDEGVGSEGNWSGGISGVGVDSQRVGGGVRVQAGRGRGPRTYQRVGHKETILRVANLTDRLVITLPQATHDLGSTRFYIALLANERPTYGTITFRQDQLHIDLFVFFSVFFSCFFLFLAGCVVAWKAKQAADARRARRRHVVEMLHMAKRAFASISLVVGGGEGGGRRPVAVEPTGDGLAAVATLLVSLPAPGRAPTSLALASTLVLLARPHRPFLRNRTSR